MIAAMTRHGHHPIAKFIRWLENARHMRIPNYEAMALATAARGGRTSVRFVLLRESTSAASCFSPDARSRKGRELRGNPRASLALYWQPKGRQVRVEGRVEEVTPAEADAYWPTRPRQSQLAASTSHQSARLSSRAELFARCEMVHIGTHLGVSKGVKRWWLLAAILTLAQPSIFASTIDAQPARASAPRASLPSGPLSPASLMDVGYSDIYNLDTGGAHKAFQVWERSHSGDPLGPTSEAAADLFWEFNQMHVL